MTAPTAHHTDLVAPAWLLVVGSIMAGTSAAQAPLTDYVPYSVGAFPTGAAKGDLDGDGNVDLAFANSQSLDISILLGNGDGTFASEVRLAGFGPARDVGIADFDADGDLDLVASVRQGAGLLALAHNDGSGQFSTPEFFEPSMFCFSLSVEDFDGNGAPDVVIAAENSNADTLGAVFLNQGAGTFVYSPATFEVSAFTYIFEVAVGHVDGDGFPDLVGANLITGEVNILAGNGDGTFGPPTRVPTTTQLPFAVALEDLDLDGCDDLILVDMDLDGPDNLLAVHLNNGAGAFGPSMTCVVQSLPIPPALLIADVDRDQRPDIILSYQLLYNVGGGAFEAPVGLPAGGDAFASLAVDLDGDHDLDIVQGTSGIGLGEHYAAVLLNQLPRRPPHKARVDRALDGAVDRELPAVPLRFGRSRSYSRSKQ